jgi:thiamine-phosphate diphosphorylase
MEVYMLSTLRSFGPPRRAFDLSLYLVANRPSFQSEELFFKKIEAAVKGGTSCVQLRDHENDLQSTLRIAHQVREITRDVPLFINTLSPFEVAKSIDAAGVFLEGSTLYAEARQALGEHSIIGTSVKTTDEVHSLNLAREVDYISVKVSASKKTCPRNDHLWGIDGLRHVRSITPHRIVAIGGLTLSTVEPVYQELHSSDGVAMAGGLMDEGEPDVTARKILSMSMGRV